MFIERMFTVQEIEKLREVLLQLEGLKLEDLELLTSKYTNPTE